MPEQIGSKGQVPAILDDDDRNNTEQWGFQRLLGMRIAKWVENYAEVELTIGEQHLNRSGMVHGGVLTALLDTALSLSGLYSPNSSQAPKGMTLSLSTTFVAPARRGVLRAVGQCRGGGRSTFMASGEVLDADGTLVAMGEGAFRIRGADVMAGG